MKKFILLLTLLAIAVPAAHADGDPSQGSDHDSQLTGAEKVGADASVADPRLPPVFPGEEVHDGKNTIKVWSTAGAVHGGEEFVPPQQYVPNYGIPGGVIVDNRNGNVNPPGGTTPGGTTPGGSAGGGIIRVPAR